MQYNYNNAVLLYNAYIAALGLPVHYAVDLQNSPHNIPLTNTFRDGGGALRSELSIQGREGTPLLLLPSNSHQLHNRKGGSGNPNLLSALQNSIAFSCKMKNY